VTASLAQEIASLDAVRAQLAAADARAALGTVERYMREHPKGALRQEAAVLRIEALLAAGEPVRVRAAAARFLKENPDSPHAPRVRALADAR
jgi:outer membrane protein assembly factor BamD (BamD/ComL family)